TPPPSSSTDYPSGDSNQLIKRMRPISLNKEVNLLVNVQPVSFHGHCYSEAFSALYEFWYQCGGYWTVGSWLHGEIGPKELQSLGPEFVRYGSAGTWQIVNS
ncbi:hypothetical protein ACH5RR_018754, partial [Cinchona calisaya]